MTRESLGSQLAFEFKSFVAAIGLMSRIPVTWLTPESLGAEHHHRAQIWYPAVGLILGFLLACCASLLPDHWNPLLYGVLLVAGWTAFTGALHLDGLADTADAWVGGMGSRQRTLEIMKDPACGPAGVTAIVLCLLLKSALVAQLLEQDFTVALILVPLLARSWLLPMLATMRYARANPTEGGLSESATGSYGMAGYIANGFPVVPGIISFLVAQLLALLLLVFSTSPLAVLCAILLAPAAVFWLIGQSANRRMGGYTGDILGAAIELYELAILIGLVWCLK